MAQTTKLLLEFPAGIDAETVKEIQREIAATDGVKQSGSSATRSLDAATLATWVTLAGAAIPVIGQLRALFARKKVKGVKLRMASGVVVEIDEMSTDDLRKLLGES
jgi:hypothetical protein